MPHLLAARVEPDWDTGELCDPEAERARLVEIEASGGIDRTKRPSRVAFIVVAVTAAISGVVVAVAGANHGGGGHRNDADRTILRYEAVVNGHDWAALERLLAPDFVFHNLDHGSTQDRRGFLAWATLIGEAYAGFALGIDAIRPSGEVAVVRFHEMRSDGRAVERHSTPVAGLAIVRVVDDQIVDLWSNFDEFGLLDERGEGR